MSKYRVEIKEHALHDLNMLKHRLIYEIIETVVRVDVLTAYGHYGDK